MAAGVMTFVFLMFALCCLPVNSLRMYERRSDLPKTPDSLFYGWTLPVGDGDLCPQGKECNSSLSLPAPDKTLTAVAIATGSFNYTCEGAEAANGPSFVEQFTNLYDAWPLLFDGYDDDEFRDLVQELSGHDYPSSKNTSLECIGSIGTINDTAVVILREMDTFEASIVETILAPDFPELNGLWAHSRSTDDDWEMYRVHMVGGLIPATCHGLDSTFDVEYAASYWFFHR